MAAQPVIVVSGLPRSGTSMMMQMLQAGGVEVIADDTRAADADNPRGYLEFQRVKQLRTDREWLEGAGGRAVKVIHLLLRDLPTDRRYQVLFMHRALDEVLRSQARMLERLGTSGGAIAAHRLAQVYEAQLASTRAWLELHDAFSWLDLQHAEVLARPLEQAERIARFLGRPMDLRAMADAVDPSLHRNRS